MKIIIIFAVYFLSTCCDGAKKPAASADPAEPWIVTIQLKNRTKIVLNLTLTEGILIDNETPVWNAQRKSLRDGIKYTRNDQVMQRIGDFDFYQDYAYKAAVVVFHKSQEILGWVLDDHFENLQYEQADPDVLNRNRNKSLLFRQQCSSQFRSTGLPIGIIEPSKWKPTRTPPDVAYPEILIQLARGDVEQDEDTAVKKMMAYWNGVDMLYQQLKNPRVRINIAGLIIPMDNNTTPWFPINNLRDSKNVEVVDVENSLNILGMHFSTLRHQFPDDSYDFVFSFTTSKLKNGRWSIAGQAFSNSSCRSRETRVAVIGAFHALSKVIHYQFTAHELGHLIGSTHETPPHCAGGGLMDSLYTKDQTLEWTSCSQQQITNYFRKKRSQCLDNCPSTMKNCMRPPIPRCVIRANDVCKLAGYRYMRQTVDCAGELRCRHNARNREILIPIPDGTAAAWIYPAERPTKICRKGQRIDHDSKIDVCELNI